MPPNAAELVRPESPLRSIMQRSPIRINQDSKFYERLLTKESSAVDPSFRYWAEPGSVPFVWESQPGTPKVDLSRMATGALPAITPPPSYLLRHGGSKVATSRPPASKAKSKKRYRFKRIKIGFIAGIFRRLTLGKAWRRSAPSSVQVSSSSRWLFSSVATERGDHHRHHDQEAAAQTKSIVLCSRARPSAPWMLRFRGLGNRNRDDGWA